MTIWDIGTKLVQLCKEGKNLQAIEALYSRDIKSVEAMSMGTGREAEGMEAILGKTKWWFDNNTVHSATIEGPFPFDDKFAVYFNYDLTPKGGPRTTMKEMGLYWVQNGKIVREEFWYKGT